MRRNKGSPRERRSCPFGPRSRGAARRGRIGRCAAAKPYSAVTPDTGSVAAALSSLPLAATRAVLAALVRAATLIALALAVLPW
ncbi:MULTISPECIES: hypothetical protein [unclassified Streptomyces]|uniref:hypothetical protein n=1 Tax=unclassified Streptomyces TaxID=2593676 RepID=UPI00225B4E05|nr:hypothetical protein [Streptomyces sp. NBC_00401]MCX5083870.1 hypothetical protein [Streptomyces sp. NBC_00401]